MLKNPSQEAMSAALVADLRTVTRLLLAFFDDIKPEVWSQRGPRVPASEWTLHQTVAHLVASAEFYHTALQYALRHETLVDPGFQRRGDLPTYNQQEIQRRQHLQPSLLLSDLQQALVATIELAQQLTPEQFLWPVAVPVFNRTLTIFELLEAQTIHPGMVHAAQIACPANTDPLWRQYEPALMHRMLTRFFRLMALTYWPERGGALHATFQFFVAGPAGGEWSVHVSPAGGQTEEGKAPKPKVTLWAANADALCQLFTNQTSIGHAILHRKLFVWGNLFLATKFDLLFLPA